ncbi:MAG TPA: hypothetical protein VFC17_02645 [Candidatus Limnocylindrales bacterium]|nr:hypothetical protein [Candidatus Limnocylindrales bacterium]
MKLTRQILTLVAAVALLQFSAVAQTNAPVAAPAVHVNTAIIPVPRTGNITNRQSLVLQRARENPGDYDSNSSAIPSCKAGRAGVQMSGRIITVRASVSTSV